MKSLTVLKAPQEDSREESITTFLRANVVPALNPEVALQAFYPGAVFRENIMTGEAGVFFRLLWDERLGHNPGRGRWVPA